jgi:hypothetical protein
MVRGFCFDASSICATRLDSFAAWIKRGRQIFKPIDALVDVGQRQQIEQAIEGRHDPGEKAVADEITTQRRCTQPAVAADVVGAAEGVKQRGLRQEIDEQPEAEDRHEKPAQGIFADADETLFVGQCRGKCRAHRWLPLRRGLDAHDRFISKITLNRAGTSVLVEIAVSSRLPAAPADDSPPLLHWEGGI